MSETTLRQKDRPEYSVWSSLKQRVTNPKHKSYKNYGGRGIKICRRWSESFDAFCADMGERPEGLTLDRVDNDGDYTPENCRWTDRVTQNRNRRKFGLSCKNNTGYTGVELVTKDSNPRWVAAICVNYKRIHLGTFGSLTEAIKAREHAESLYWGASV